jgi:hypothetical protein
MPADHDLGLDERYCLKKRVEQSIKAEKQGAIEPTYVQPVGLLASQNGELVT